MTTNTICLIVDIFLLVVCILQILANLLVLVVWLINRKLRTNDNLILLVSLAFIDFVYAVLQFPYLVILIVGWKPDGKHHTFRLNMEDHNMCLVNNITANTYNNMYELEMFSYCHVDNRFLIATENQSGRKSRGALVAIELCVAGQMFDYNPWIIVPLVGPSASLMKSGCTVTTAIALDRILAFYFPVQYYQLSKRSTAAFFFAICMASIDWMVLQSTVTIAPNPGCSSFGCFTNPEFRAYWGLSNMLMNFASCALTVLIIYHLYNRPGITRDIEKVNRAKIDKSANRVAIYILLVSALIGVVPGCLNGIGIFITIPLLEEISFFVGTSATLSGLSHAFIFAMAHREFQRAILKLFGCQKKTGMIMPAASFLNPNVQSSSTGRPSSRHTNVYNIEMRRHM